MEAYERTLISPDCEIKSGLKQMDETGEKILFVADSEKVLIGTVTDGDIRRWILKGGSLNEAIDRVTNRKPIFLKTGFTFAEARKTMLSNLVEYLPVVDQDMKINAVIRWVELFEHKFRRHRAIELPVVIMAGGRGSRLSPFTNILPKALIPVGDKPIIEMIMDRFFEYGCHTFYLSLNHKSTMVKSYFNDISHDYTIHYVEEEQYLGTSGSLSLLKDTLKSTFFLSNCDVLIEADYGEILEFHRMQKNAIIIVASVRHYVIPYGICRIRNGGFLEKIVEKPEYEFLVNTGLYILEPEILHQIPENSHSNMTDLINELLEKREKIGTFPISEKSWLDIGQLEEWEDTIKRFGNKNGFENT